MAASTSPWPLPSTSTISSPRPSVASTPFVPGALPADLMERLADLCARSNVRAFLADFDKRKVKRIRTDEAVRALSAAGLELSPTEQTALSDAYKSEDGFFLYEAFLLDASDIRPAGFLETRSPALDASLTSPRARFAFSGVCSPSRFGVRRVTLTPAEEEALAIIFREMHTEAQPHALVVAFICRPFDPTGSGLITAPRFVRAILTHFQRLTLANAELLARAYSGGADGQQVRYIALSDDVTPESKGDEELARSARAGAAHAPCANERTARALAGGASDEEVASGFRVLLRVLHERRIRIADVVTDFSRHSPFPGRITHSQLVRALSGVVGLPAVEPRVIISMASTYCCVSDPSWVDMHALIADCEATSYLRGLESGNPDAQNMTFARDVALSPSPRFQRPEAIEEDAAALHAALKRMQEAAARNRVTTPRIFGDQYDLNKEGYLSRERFLRMLTTAHMMPPAEGSSEGDLARILAHYRHASNESLVDYKGFFLDLGLA